MISQTCRMETRKGPKHLGVLDDEMSGRQDQSDQGGGEEHLDDGDIAVVATEDLGEGVGMVDSEAFRGACVEDSQL